MFQRRTKTKIPEKDLSEVEIRHLADQELRVMVKKMLKEFERRMDGAQRILTKS